MSNFLTTLELRKDFGNATGVFDLDINLQSGQILGFIGPNGAGKTTTMLMLAGLIKADSGQIKIFERLITPNNIHQIMPKIGIMMGDKSFEPHLTPRQILSRSSRLLNLQLDPVIQEKAKMLKLNLDRKFGNLSLGNQKKVGIINALMHQPKLVLLDEPTSGLDPLVKQYFLEELLAVKARGGAILLSSHVLSEIQAICDSILMIKNGKKTIQGKTQEILEKSQKLFRFENLNSKHLQTIKKLPQITKIVENKFETLVYAGARKEILDYLNENQITDFYLERVSLEETFLESYR